MDHKSKGIDEHGCTTTPGYQLIDEGRNTTEKGQLKGTYHFLSCGCIDLVNKFNIFLPDNPCRKVGLADSQYRMENSSGALLL